MDNFENAVEKDYAPQIDIPDQNQENQNTIPQVDVESQNQENRNDETVEDENKDSNEIVDQDLNKKWKEQKKKLSKIQREKHRIAAEVEQLRQENEQLKKYNQTSNEVGQAHYENSLKLKLEQAKENKRKARELNDIESEISADEEIASAITDIRAMDSWKAQQIINQKEIQQYQQNYANYNQYEQQRNSYEQPEYELNDQTEIWLKHNPWFDEKSSHYDPDKAEEVLLYAQTLDANLARQGREEELMTKAYFDRINSFARHYDQQRNNSHQERISNASNVAPVRRMQSNQSNSNNIKLTDDEKFMAKNAGISEDDWKKAKLEDMRRQKEKMKYQNPIY